MRIFTQEVEFLGHIVSNAGLAVDPQKVHAIRTWPVPKDPHEVRQFLGLVWFYRRFIQQFASIAAPLTDLLSTKKAFMWTEACEPAFHALIHAVTTAPVLVTPDLMSDAEFTLETDASLIAVGGVLSQNGQS
jgi:hypothetical protein